MIRLIGGSARCGKSTLARLVSDDYSSQLISLDCLRRSLLSVASNEMYNKLKPAADIDDNDANTWLEKLRDRDCALWRGAEAYLEAASALNDDVLMEGGLWPDYVTELSVSFRAVFLVDTSVEHADRVIAAERNRSTHNNWMKDRDDAWLRKWSEYNIERSRLYVILAKEYNQPVFDIGELGFEEVQERAMSYLFS